MECMKVCSKMKVVLGSQMTLSVFLIKDSMLHAEFGYHLCFCCTRSGCGSLTSDVRAVDCILAFPNPGVLDFRRVCLPPPSDHWQRLRAFWVVTTVEGRCRWRLVGSEQGCSRHLKMHRVTAPSTPKDYPVHDVNTANVENSALTSVPILSK